MSRFVLEQVTSFGHTVVPLESSFLTDRAVVGCQVTPVVSALPLVYPQYLVPVFQTDLILWWKDRSSFRVPAALLTKSFPAVISQHHHRLCFTEELLPF